MEKLFFAKFGVGMKKFLLILVAFAVTALAYEDGESLDPAEVPALEESAAQEENPAEVVENTVQETQVLNRNAKQSQQSSVVAQEQPGAEKQGYWHNYSRPVRFYAQLGYSDIAIGLKVKMSRKNYFYMMQGVMVQHHWFNNIDYLRVTTEFCGGGTHFHGVLGIIVNLSNDGFADYYDLDPIEIAYGVKYDLNAHLGFSTRIYGPLAGYSSEIPVSMMIDAVYAF